MCGASTPGIKILRYFVCIQDEAAAAGAEKDPAEAAMEAMMIAAAAAAAEEQARGNIPIQQDFFTGVDASEAGADEDAPNPEEE